MRRMLSGVMRHPRTMVGILLMVGVASSVCAQRGGWDHLGTKEIEGRVDHDKINVHGKDTYQALQFRVTGAAVQFDRIVVEYGNHNDARLPVPHAGARPTGRAPRSTSSAATATSPTWSSGTRRRPGARSRKCGCTEGDEHDDDDFIESAWAARRGGRCDRRGRPRAAGTRASGRTG